MGPTTVNPPIRQLALSSRTPWHACARVMLLSRCSAAIQCIACSSPTLGPTTCTHCAGLLIKEKKDFKAAKTLVLAFIAKEDPAHGRSSIKQRAGGAPPTPEIPAATEGALLLLSLSLWS